MIKYLNDFFTRALFNNLVIFLFLLRYLFAYVINHSYTYLLI